MSNSCDGHRTIKSKPLKRLVPFPAQITGLKAGVNKSYPNLRHPLELLKVSCGILDFASN